ncbi:MAG TPA: tartrate-resistant acid phosphatase type 5 family protein [Gemmatimonadaceae bacterium]|nr:tartrate-resistant acid phosphatase type 5 family protein [Gemmatimonadaceae bacterium]
MRTGIGLVAIIALAAAGVAQGQQVNFLVIGDWGRDGDGFQTKVATQMVAAARARPIDFVVSVGDNFYEEGVRTTHDRQFTTSFERVYADSALQVPWYVALGNHDYQGDPQAQVDYTQVSRRWHMPARYFSVVKRIDDSTTVELFIVDTTPFIEEYRTEPKYARVAHADTRPQLRWLDSALAASTAQWKIVFGHHPVYSASPKHGNTPELIRDFKPLFEKYHVQVYVAGHDHNLQDLHTPAVEYFISGGGSEGRIAGRAAETRFSATSAGFLAVRLDAATLHARFINPKGKTLYKTTVPRHALVAAHAGAS